MLSPYLPKKKKNVGKEGDAATQIGSLHENVTLLHASVLYLFEVTVVFVHSGCSFLACCIFSF